MTTTPPHPRVPACVEAEGTRAALRPFPAELCSVLAEYCRACCGRRVADLGGSSSGQRGDSSLDSATDGGHGIDDSSGDGSGGGAGVAAVSDGRSVDDAVTRPRDCSALKQRQAPLQCPMDRCTLRAKPKCVNKACKKCCVRFVRRQVDEYLRTSHRDGDSGVSVIRSCESEHRPSIPLPDEYFCRVHPFTCPHDTFFPAAAIAGAVNPWAGDVATNKSCGFGVAVLARLLSGRTVSEPCADCALWCTLAWNCYCRTLPCR